MSRRSILSTLVGLALLPMAAGAQAPVTRVAGPSPSDRLSGRLDQTTREAVLAVVDSARHEGLPVDPLIERALEGASKRAPGPTIVNVVRNYRRDLSRARTVLGQASTPEEIKAGAEALRSGIKASDLERLRAARNGQRLAVTLVVMAELIHREVTPDTASAAIYALAQQKASDDHMLYFLHEVVADITSHTPPDQAVASRRLETERMVAAGIPAGNSADAFGTLPSGRTAPGASSAGSAVASPNGPANVNKSPAASASVESTDPAATPPKPRPAAAPRGKPKKHL